MPISLQKECSPEKPGGNQECGEMKEGECFQLHTTCIMVWHNFYL